MADADSTQTKAEQQSNDKEDEETQTKEPRPKRARTARPQPRDKAESDSRMQQSDSVLLFDKYDYDVQVADLSLRNYINLKPLAYPSTYRRNSTKSFSKANVNVVERLTNSLMRGGTGGKISGHLIRTKGRLQGKKMKAMHVVEEAFEIVQKQTGKNPLQVLVMALENSAPIEDTTTVVYGGIRSNVAVDISASRRLDTALRNLAMAAIISSFGSRRRLAEALAAELILTANMDLNSYAIKRKNEIERMARSAK
jgi:small subunit ribosomal protein S7